MFTLKKFKHYPRMSEETIAFNADVYWSGVLIGHAENGGKGAQSSIWPPNKIVDRAAYEKAVAEANAFAKAQPIMIDDKHMTGRDGEKLYFDSVSDYIDVVVGDEIDRTARINQLKRRMRTKTLLIDNGTVYELKAPFSPQVKAGIAKKWPNAIVLNELTFEEALERAIKAGF